MVLRGNVQKVQGFLIFDSTFICLESDKLNGDVEQNDVCCAYNLTGLCSCWLCKGPHPTLYQDHGQHEEHTDPVGEYRSFSTQARAHSAVDVF